VVDIIELGSNEIPLFLIAMNLTVYILVVILIFFVMYLIISRLTNVNKNKIAKIFTVLVLVVSAYLVSATANSVGERPVSNQDLMTLLQAESMIIQIQEVDLPKDPSAIDVEKSNEWVKVMRNTIEKGYVTRAEYIDLGSQFTALNIGRNNMKKMIAENSTDKVRTQVRQALSQQALADQQRLVEHAAQQKVDTDGEVIQPIPTEQ
jgi:hypothetical protein